MAEADGTAIFPSLIGVIDNTHHQVVNPACKDVDSTSNAHLKCLTVLMSYPNTNPTNHRTSSLHTPLNVNNTSPYSPARGDGSRVQKQQSATP